MRMNEIVMQYSETKEKEQREGTSTIIWYEVLPSI